MRRALFTPAVTTTSAGTAPVPTLQSRLLSRKVAVLALGAAVALEALWRLPFLHFPITTDEGGYAEVARLWERGGSLYGSAWADRPQGLLLIFRGLLHVGGGSPAVLRAAAIVAGIVLLGLVALVARELGGGRLAVAAAVVLGCFGCTPFIESFTLSGELLASIPATASLLCALRYVNRGGLPWLVGAGFLSGCAVMVKQSAFDALLATALLLCLTRRRYAVRPLMVLFGAAAVPVVVGWLTTSSGSAWWEAVVACRGQGDSIVTGSPAARLLALGRSLRLAAKALAPLLILAYRGWAPAPRLIRLWLLAGLVGVLGGGNFHAHYYIQLVPTLAVLAGLGLMRILAGPFALLAWLPAAAAVVLTIVTLTPVYSGSTAQQVDLIYPSDSHLKTDRQTSDYVRSHTSPGEPVLVLPPVASIYYLADRPPALRFMWVRPAQTVPGARSELLQALERRTPGLIVEYTGSNAIDPSGQAGAALKRGYRVVAHLPNAVVLRRLSAR